MSEKPGVMVYFDMLPAIQSLSKADKGVLFESILEYGLKKTDPANLSKKLMVIWPIVKVRLDRDEIQYHNVVNKRAYSAYVRWAKHNGQVVMDFQTWQEKKNCELLQDRYDVESDVFPREI